MAIGIESCGDELAKYCQDITGYSQHNSQQLGKASKSHRAVHSVRSPLWDSVGRYNLSLKLFGHRILEDVRTRLKDASSKTGMEKWKFLQQIKSLTSNRPSKCTLVLKTCQADVSESANALQVRRRDFAPESSFSPRCLQEYFNQERSEEIYTWAVCG